MKKCSYCGRDNKDESVYCRECGTEFGPNIEVVPAADPKRAEELLSRRLAFNAGGLKTIASIEVGMAVELIERLLKSGIPAEAKPVELEGGLDFREILVEDCNYECACDAAEAWETERLAEAEKRAKRTCSRCGSRKIVFFTTDSIGRVWKCNACGYVFAK